MKKSGNLEFGFRSARPAISILNGFLLAFGLGLAGPSEGVQPRIWREDSQQGFASGEQEGVSLTREGVVTLGPSFDHTADTGEEFVWALAEGKGGKLYIATGNEGRIYEMAKSGSPELLFDSPEVAIFSLAVSSDGTLFAGSSPDGMVYRIAPGKEPTLLCRTGDKHVWALVSDGETLYASTGGDRGRILKISSKGDVSEIYRSSEPNLVSMIRGPDGSLYAGSDENGLIYKVSKDGSVGVLYDAKEKEIHALAIGSRGVIYAGAMSGSVQPPGRGNQASNQQKGKSKLSSAVYAVQPSGAAYRMWDVDEPMILALHVDFNDEIQVLTGDEGRVYQVREDGTATLLAKMADIQPWTMLPAADGSSWIGTSGAGKTHRLGSNFSQKGTQTSAPQDFKLVSHWGKVRWKAETPVGTSVKIQTRSGNSEKPDDTWSDWSEPVSSGSQISSPPARFLQYRARLNSDSGESTPRLREVTLAGLQENVQPQIMSIDIAQLNGHGKDGNAGSENGNGAWKISWAAGDVNDDELVYSVFFRGRDESEWKLLKEDLNTGLFSWNTDSAPDGTMQVRVVASDRLSNPESLALWSEKVSNPFDIDHTAPEIQLEDVRQETAGTVSIRGTVIDGTSPIREASYALNSGPWQVVFPTDRIFDSKNESLTFQLPSLSPGEYTLVVRAVDALGNIGVGKQVFKVK